MSTKTKVRKNAQKPKRKRNIVNTVRDRNGTFFELQGVLDNPTLWELVAKVPPQSAEGQRRKLPEIFYPLMIPASGIWRSFSKAEANLRDELTWNGLCFLVCKYQRKHRPNDTPFDLRKLRKLPKLTAADFFYARKTWLAPYLPELRGIYRRHAADAARMLGYCDPHGAGSINDLRRERMFVSDGKVVREPASIYRPLTEGELETLQKRNPEATELSHVFNKRTRRIIAAHRMNGSVWIYKTGDGRIVIGNKIVKLLVRDNARTNSTVILDVAADNDRDEGKLTVEMATFAKKQLPGALGLVVDGVVKGIHIRSLARTGLLTVAPIAAASNPGKSRHSSKRVEKRENLGTEEHHHLDGSKCAHEFIAIGAQVHEIITDSAGKKTTRSLGDPHLEERKGKKITTINAVYKVNCERRPDLSPNGRTFDLRWNISGYVDSSDLNSDFNVAEHIRALPPGGAKYTQAYGWRQTVENENNQSDERKYQRRGRSHNSFYNELNELGIAMIVTGVAVQRYANGWQLASAAAPPTLRLVA
jgi:hypothetical protein